MSHKCFISFKKEDSDYKDLLRGLLRHGKQTLVSKVLDTMDEHFIKLRDSDREEVREYYPGRTAKEMFLLYENIEGEKKTLNE